VKVKLELEADEKDLVRVILAVALLLGELLRSSR
jgi:hypothetical protein